MGTKIHEWLQCWQATNAGRCVIMGGLFPSGQLLPSVLRFKARVLSSKPVAMSKSEQAEAYTLVHLGHREFRRQ